MSRVDLESASFRAEQLAAHSALIALAADGLIADGDNINGKKFQAGAYALEEQLDALAIELKRLSEIWRLEGIAAKAK